MKKPRGQFAMDVVRWRWLIVKADGYARVQQAGWELFAYMMEQLEFDSCSGGLPVSGSRTGRGRVDLLQEPRSPRGRVAARFLATVLERPEVKRLLSDDHFSLNGTLIQAWPSMKSFRPKGDPAEPPTGGRNDGRDFHDRATTNPLC